METIPFYYTILLTIVFVIFVVMYVMIMSFKKSLISDPLFFFEKLKILLFIIAQSFFIALLSNGDIFQDMKVFPNISSINQGFINYAFDRISFLSYIFQIVAMLTFVLGIILLPISHTSMNYEDQTVDETITDFSQRGHSFVYNTMLKVVSVCFAFTFSLFMIRFAYQMVFKDSKLEYSPKNVTAMSGFYFTVPRTPGTHN